MPLTARVLLSGRRLTLDEIVAVAHREADLRVSSEVSKALGDLHRAIARNHEIGDVYGRSTGVGANKSVAVVDDAHGLRLLRSHAVEIGDELPAVTVRAMLAVRLNQLSFPGSGIDPDVVDALARMLRDDALPSIRAAGASVGTADLSALARTALTLAGELPASRPVGRPVAFDAASALPFLSSSALTLGRSALALVDASRLARAADAVFSVTARAVHANPQHWSRTAAAATAIAGASVVAGRLRSLLDRPGLPSTSRIQDRFGVRAYPAVHGALDDSLARASTAVEMLASTAQENPLFVLDHETAEAVHHGGFFHIGLALDLDSLNNALGATASLTLARLAMLNEPSLTGLAPFLAAGPPGSSGAMVVEYVAAAAGAEMRAAAMPVATGTAVLSRGTEEDAPFAPQAVTQLERSLSAWRTVLGSELLLGLRALDQQNQVGTLPAAVRNVVDPLVGAYGDHSDRDLSPVVAACVSCLEALAAAVDDERPLGDVTKRAGRT